MDADYVKVMSLLPSRATSAANPFIGTAAGTILDLIRSRAMVQYVAPFSSVSISTMGEAFGMNSGGDDCRGGEIGRERLGEGRIDLIDKVCPSACARGPALTNQVLDVRSPNPRSKMIKHAYETGRTTTEATAAALVRMRMWVQQQPFKNCF